MCDTCSHFQRGKQKQKVLRTFQPWVGNQMYCFSSECTGKYRSLQIKWKLGIYWTFPVAELVCQTFPKPTLTNSSRFQIFPFLKITSQSFLYSKVYLKYRSVLMCCVQIVREETYKKNLNVVNWLISAVFYFCLLLVILGWEKTRVYSTRQDNRSIPVLSFPSSSPSPHLLHLLLLLLLFFSLHFYTPVSLSSLECS